MAIKRKTIAIVAGLAVFAAVSASAATLGGLTTSDLGANSAAVAGQFNGGVSVSFTTAYDSTVGTGGGYKVTSVTLTPLVSGDKFPSGGTIQLTLKGADGASLGEFTLVPSSAVASAIIPVSGSVAANAVSGASLVINGGATTVSLNP